MLSLLPGAVNALTGSTTQPAQPQKRILHYPTTVLVFECIYSNGTHAMHAFVVCFKPFATSFALLKKQLPWPVLEFSNVLATHDGSLLHIVQHATGPVAGCCGALAPSFQSMLRLNLQLVQCFGNLIDANAQQLDASRPSKCSLMTVHGLLRWWRG